MTYLERLKKALKIPNISLFKTRKRAEATRFNFDCCVRSNSPFECVVAACVNKEKQQSGQWNIFISLLHKFAHYACLVGQSPHMSGKKAQLWYFRQFSIATPAAYLAISAVNVFEKLCFVGCCSVCMHGAYNEVCIPMWTAIQGEI